MRQRLVGLCYTILKIFGVYKPCGYLLSRKLIYSSNKSFKREFDNDYLMVITRAKSPILFNKTVASAYLQSGYWEMNDFDYCGLRSLWVHPLLKRRGVASRIVSEVINNAQTLGFKHLVLTCEMGNFAAQHLYKKCGFQLIDDDKSYTRFVKERTYLEELSHRNNCIYWMRLNN